jgi:hypothetical protein
MLATMVCSLTPAKPVEWNAKGWPETFHAYKGLEHMGIVDSATWATSEGKYIIATYMESQIRKSMISQNGVDVRTSVSDLVV